MSKKKLKEEKHICECEDCTCEDCTCEDCTCDNCECNDCNCVDKNETVNETDEYKRLLQVVQADFDNYRKRSLTLMNEAKLDGQINVILRFLPALDSFKKAKEMIDDKNILKGIEMIENEIIDALKSFGVEKIDAMGQKFDTKYHNAIMVKSDNSLEDDVVCDIYQDGYKLNDRVIRYSQVVINKKGE